MQKDLQAMSLEELWQLFPIVLTPHDNNWGNYYQEEKTLLLKILKDVNISRISHIGSTAIKDIWAKPIIDILMEVTDVFNLHLAYQKLSAQGYLCMAKSENRIDFNKGYTQYGFADKVYHLHPRFSGDNDELYFRDYMNSHPILAKEYETLKLFLGKLYEHNRDAYTEAKSSFVQKYTKLAKHIYINRYSDAEA